MIWLILLALLAFGVYAVVNVDMPVGPDPDRPPCILPTLPKFDEEEEEEETSQSPRGLIAERIESLDWLNEITKACWPHVCAIVQKELGPTAEPLIDVALPKPLKNFKFVKSELGKDYLLVDRVTVHKRYKDAIALDLDVSFKGKPDISMKVSPMAGTFGVEEMRWSGRLSVLMRPLTTTLPCVGAVQAAFVDHPEIYLNFSGAAALADFGPVKDVVRKVMRDVVASMFVLPNRFLFKLNDAVDFFDVYYPPLGALNITIRRGRGFIKEKKGGFIKLTPDVYVKMKFGLEKSQTPVVKKSLTPEWGHSKIFVLSDDDQPLELKGMDDDPVSDDLLGEVRILASELIKTPQRWVKFEREVDVVAENAEILVEAETLAFTETLGSGPVMVSVLIDRVTGLPDDTNSAQCKIEVAGKAEHEKLSAMIVRPEEPVPGVDPANPIFNLSTDVIVPSVRHADVKVTLTADKNTVGKIHFDAAGIDGSPGNTKQGDFKIGGGASIRCKVVLRGLTRDGAPAKSARMGGRN